jgi:ABC-type nitrate/sulfonate/bicarbonate transport system permease component
MREGKSAVTLRDALHSVAGALLLAIVFALVAHWLMEKSDWGVGRWIRQFFDSFADVGLWKSLVLTLKRFLEGYVCAVVLGSVLGLAMGRIVTAERVLALPVNALRTIPSAAVVPFSLALLPAAGDGIKIFIIAYGSIWPVLLQVAQGSRDVDRMLIDTGRTLGKSRWRVFFGVVLPATLPAALTGARVGLGIGLLLAVTAEMLTPSDAGLGYLILDFERSFHYPQMVVAVIVLAAVGASLDWGFRRIESRLVGWHHGHSRR